MTRALRILAPVALVLLLLAAWEAAVRLLHVPAYVLPAPSAIARAAAGNEAVLLRSAWNTLSMALVALLAASLIANALALLVAPSPLMESAVRPLAVALQVTPVVAIAPQAVIWAGLDHPERAVVARPEILFFDEPTTGLDPITAAAINQLISDQVRRLGSTAVSITHDLASAQTIGDEIAMLHDGKIVWRGPAAELSTTDNPYVRQFVEGRAEGPISHAV